MTQYLNLSQTEFKKQFSALLTEIDQTVGNKFVKLLTSHHCFRNFPKDVRSYVHTPRKRYPTRNLGGGEYMHFGFIDALKRIIKLTPAYVNIPRLLEIDLSIDGKTYDHENAIHLWPIQIRISNIPRSQPEFVGIWLGKKKISQPTCFKDYLKPLIKDAIPVFKNGVNLSESETKTPVKFRCFIADAPARSKSLGHYAHNSKVPCSKCKVIGTTIRRGVTVYMGTSWEARTDEEYSLRLDGSHHKDKDCPLAELPFGQVSQVVFEYMHLCCLGVMKRVLNFLIEERVGCQVTIPKEWHPLLINRLTLISHYCPKEFSRQPIDVSKHNSWKATELRQVLLYSGPIFLYGVVLSSVYTHFLILHVLMRILSRKHLTEIDKMRARNFVKVFINKANSVYGPEFVSFNVHGLLHLVEDVERFGPIDDFSAFPFENNMRYFNSTIRKPEHILQQIHRRRAEDDAFFESKSNPESIVLNYPHDKGPLADSLSEDECLQFGELKSPLFYVSLSKKNNTLLLKDRKVCLVQNILKIEEKIWFIVKFFCNVKNLFLFPIESSEADIFLCASLSSQLDLVSFDDVVGKCFRMPYWDSESLTIVEKPVEGSFVVSLLLSSTQ